MDLNWHTFALLPVGLGLLGFIEPCTIGGHLVFLDTQAERTRSTRVSAALTFSVTRALMTGLFGAFIAFVGQILVGVQTGVWLIFGLIYFGTGAAFLLGRSGFMKWNIDLAPKTWRQVSHPIALGLAFGLNIPACAAPILFGLLGLAATAGTAASGFAMMFLFGLALSAPLVVFAFTPHLSGWLIRAGEWMKQRAWLTGMIFVLLGVWSIWFGLYVDPANWSGR